MKSCIDKTIGDLIADCENVASMASRVDTMTKGIDKQIATLETLKSTGMISIPGVARVDKSIDFFKGLKKELKEFDVKTRNQPGEPSAVQEPGKKTERLQRSCTVSFIKEKQINDLSSCGDGIHELRIDSDENTAFPGGDLPRLNRFSQLERLFITSNPASLDITINGNHLPSSIKEISISPMSLPGVRLENMKQLNSLVKFSYADTDAATQSRRFASAFNDHVRVRIASMVTDDDDDVSCADGSFIQFPRYGGSEPTWVTRTAGELKRCMPGGLMIDITKRDAQQLDEYLGKEIGI